MRLIERAWWYKQRWIIVLAPLSGLFWLLSLLRRWCFRQGWLASYKVPVPVIVVGNISVGGNGKTPVVLALAEALKARGLNPGILSRGYGASCNVFPHLIQYSDDAQWVGDEPKLLASRSGCDVVIDPDRVRGARLLSQSCNVIICDDGLQHYRLQRDIEIVVMDNRLIGNGWLLPCGPLREGSWRLSEVDHVIINGDLLTDFPFDINPVYMQLTAQPIKPILAAGSVPNDFQLACAAIGNPQRFFDTLNDYSIVHQHTQTFNDHHVFSKDDFVHSGEPFERVIMTEKDAVKCHSFAQKHWCYLPVVAQFSEDVMARIYQDMKELLDEQ